ncbi:MAG: hypothetical protein ACJ79U_22435 [Myxococcales bacterium]
MTFILVFPVAFFLFTGLRAVQLAREGEVPGTLRDLDCDGMVSFVEWLRGGLDFRLRGRADGCTDIVHVKSGRVLVVHCDTEPSCRPQRKR